MADCNLHYSSAWDCEALLRGKINKNRILTREMCMTADFAERGRERERERERKKEIGEKERQKVQDNIEFDI